ncbi:MAG: polysaccharide deacetylase family protein [Pseudomonadota bacterium]
MRGSLAILNFHGIGVPHDGVPADEVPYWVSADKFRTVLDQIKQFEAQGGQALITFDDGNRSDLEIASPELKLRNMTGHFFILTGRFGDPRYLSPVDLLRLQESGMAIGLHGRDHVDWRKLDTAGLAAETIDARHRLGEIVGQRIDTVGIPFGAYNRRVIEHLKQAGFQEIYTSDGGYASRRRVVRHRTSVRSDMSDSQIAGVLNGRESVVAKTRRGLKAWLKEHIVA